ncbi:hypothetical protein QJS66_04190 [Kocuria rhizophila]|nr:hypothetical protein QJS66_04190 [Kocuria rhizophila]
MKIAVLHRCCWTKIVGFVTRGSGIPRMQGLREHEGGPRGDDRAQGRGVGAHPVLPVPRGRSRRRRWTASPCCTT